MKTTPRGLWVSALCACLGLALDAAAADPEAAVDPTTGIELMQVSDMYIRSKGKCYFEVSYDVGAVARAMQEPAALLLIGCVADTMPVGFLGRIIADEHKQRPVRHVGIAVDFDRRRLAMRNNGEWADNGPIETGGFAMPDAKVTTCGVMSTKPIARLLAGPQVMQINWGQKAFRLEPPAGFKPYGEGVAY